MRDKEQSDRAVSVVMELVVATQGEGSSRPGRSPRNQNRGASMGPGMPTSTEHPWVSTGTG